MSQSQSDKKTCKNSIITTITANCISDYIVPFSYNFKSYRFDNTSTAINYLKGLLTCPKGKANMERMEEYVSESEYRAYQHFISNSKWNSQGLFDQVATDTSTLFQQQKEKNKKAVGYIIDESSHLKKGEKSIGVTRQYAGTIGKVDNCQVGVYSSLVNHKYASIINERIFLPESWTNKPERCEEAKVPEDCREYKTKPQLALEMIKEDIERGVKFDWIGGDGLYGHNSELRDGLDDLGQFFVLDVHKDERVYLQKPSFSVPKAIKGRGRKPTLPKADITSVRLDEVILDSSKESWKLEKVIDTISGVLTLRVFKKEVWIWNKKTTKIKKYTLIITKTTEKKPKIKYCLSNGDIKRFSHKEYAYFICQRYWIERTFDNAKNELGMSDYQVRKWQSWHNHHAIVMLASLFITKQQIENEEATPLLSFSDARILIVTRICFNQVEMDKKIKQMEKRHKKRQKDIDWRYKKQLREENETLTS